MPKDAPDDQDDENKNDNKNANDGKKGNSGDDGNNNNNDDKKDAKLEEELKKENDKLKQDLEDIRTEVLSPEYLEYLQNKGKGKSGKSGKDDSNKGDDDNNDPYKGLTPKQIADKIKAELAEAEAEREQDETKKEIAAFARTHKDFETMRPIMFGLSRDPKFKDYSLEELYVESKEYTKRITQPPSDKDKEKSRRSGNEKPGGASNSFKPDNKGKSDAELAEEAWDEVVGDKGLPPAV